MKNQRKCATCCATLIGRRDKVFCSIECKNLHHKIARIQTKQIQSIINKRIRRNYVVLSGIFGLNSKTIEIHENLLFQYGYDVNAFIQKKAGTKSVIYQILEFELKRLGNGVWLIVRTTKPKKYFKEFVRRWRREFSKEFYLPLKLCKDKITRYFCRKLCFEGSLLTAKAFINKLSDA